MELGIDIQGNLFPNGLTMLTQLMATFIILVMFRVFLWKPVHKILDRRSEEMQKELGWAREKNEQAEELLEQAKATEEQAQKTGRQIVRDARDEADRLREKTMSEADAKVRSRMQAAEADIAQKEKEMRAELQDEVADLAMLATEALLNEKADDRRDREFIENFLKGQ